MAIWIFFQVLREQICQALADLQAKPKDDSLLLEAADLVKLATRDFKVWKGGLDAAYSKFLATYSTSFSDAILSILWRAFGVVICYSWLALPHFGHVKFEKWQKWANTRKSDQLSFMLPMAQTGYVQIFAKLCYQSSHQDDPVFFCIGAV